MYSLLERAAKKRTPSPCVIARAVEGMVAGTPVYEKPVLHGDRETVQRKKFKISLANSSHKPGFVMESKDRNKRGRPRKITFEKDSEGEQIFDVNVETSDEDVRSIKEQDSCTPKINTDVNMGSKEINMHKGSWAIRRMPCICMRKCFGVLQGKRCNNVMHSRTPGLVAPSFWGERTYKDKKQLEWLWFCNHDVEHTKGVAKQVLSPPDAPSVWTVDKGTNVTLLELAGLVGGGFVFSDDFDQMGNGRNADNSRTRCKKWRSGISKEAAKRLEADSQLHATFIEEQERVPNRHVIFKICTENVYEVHVKEEPSCSCPDFQKREFEKKSFVACKHLYFVYTRLLGLDGQQHKIIHQPVLDAKDLNLILSQSRKMAVVIRT